LIALNFDSTVFTNTKPAADLTMDSNPHYQVSLELDC